MDDYDYLQPIKQSTKYTVDEIQEAIENCLAQGKLNTSSCRAIWNQRGFPCTRNSVQTGNGLGCSWYALHDECPDEDKKGYWSCLPN